MTNNNHSWTDIFEPLGTTCEIGFVLQKLDSARPSVFRWSGIRPADLRRLLDEKFHDAFALENLTPINAGMVLDSRYQWAFHSALKSDENGKFIAAPEDLSRMHRIERVRIINDIAEFQRRLTHGRIVCVLVAPSSTEEDLAKTLAAIDGYSGNQTNQLLLVTGPSGTAEVPGSVIRISPRIARGIVTRPAPYNLANDADYENWENILRSFV